MWLPALFGSRKHYSSRSSARSAKRDSLRRDCRRLFLEPLEDRRLLAFLATESYPGGTNPQAVVAGHFNSDTILDLAVANPNYSSSTVSVLLGNADGTFQPALSSPTGNSPLSVAVGDFNADGKLDLATANAYDVSVLLGNGNGTFQAPTNIALGSNPTSLAVGDFNNDGKLDLGATSNVYYPGGGGGCGYYGCYPGYPGYYAGHVNLLLGNGLGSFAPPIASYLGYGYHNSAAVADFNGDLKLDFASTSGDYGTVDVVLGTGTGAFGSPVAFGAGYYPYSLAAGDVNADGKSDLVTADFYGNTLSVLLGNGSGSFGAAQSYNGGSQPYSVAMADFNGDGAIDLATSNWGSDTLSVLLGTGAGAFKPPVTAAAGADPLGVAVGDFSGDGRPDAALANSSSNSLSVLLNDGVWPALDAPSITINNASVTEGNTGTVSANFTVSLSAAYTQTVTVHYATVAGSAVAGSDYQAAEGTLTFTAGQTSQPLTVLVNGDQLAEYSESFSVILTDPENAFVANTQGFVTILDDEPSVSVESYVSSAEGNTGTTVFTFVVTLSAAYDAPVTVAYSTADLTEDEQWWYGTGATAGVDYTAKSGTVTFAAGDTSETITVQVTGDRVVEPDELFWVNLGTSNSAHVTYGQALANIVDDEPRASINSASVVEGHTGTAAMIFTVTLSAASDVPVTVDFETADGSATVAGGDYQATSGTVTFAIGQTSQPISIPVNGDRLGEYDEYFYVNLIGAGTGYGTIVDDEPSLSINSVSITEGNRGTKLLTFTVTLSAAYDQTVTVNYATGDSGATAGSDYVAAAGTLTFAPSQTTRTFTVTIKGDKRKESDESFWVTLSGASSNAQVDGYYGFGTIVNDDHGNGNGR